MKLKYFFYGGNLAIQQFFCLLFQDMKHYYIKHAEYIISEGKYRASESDHQKAVDSPLKKGNEKRLKNIEKTVDKVGSNLHHFLD